MPQNKSGWGALYDLQERTNRAREEGSTDISSTLVPDHSSTRPVLSEPEQTAPVIGENKDSSTLVSDHQSTLVPESKYYRKPNHLSDALDRELTSAESKVYEHLWRMTVGFNRDRVQMRVSTLCKRTGYRSMKTVRVALFGLESKGLIKKVSRNNDPLGDEYVMLDSGTRVLESSSTPAENTLVLESKTTRHLNTNLKNKELIDDDEAFAKFLSTVKQTVRELTGRDPAPAEAERWGELADVLMMELRIAAGRTTVSSVPAFLTEHLRRRLFKKDRTQLAGEEKSAAPPSSKVDASKCPDCFGTGMWYPEGYEKGVSRCAHDKLREAD